MRRWIFRIGLGIVALLLAIVLIVQIVLWTNLPRRIVLGQLQKQLGLRVSAASLSTGWLGNTSLGDVSLSLPLADEAFLSVPRMRVSHTSLPMLLIRRSVTVDAIELDEPKIVIRRDSAGRWNLADVAELVARTGGKQNTPTSTAPPKLPRIQIDRATVIVEDYGKQKVTIEPLGITGKPDGALVWRYDVQVPGHVSVVGELAPGAPWKHEVEAKIKDIDGWAKPWMPDFPANAAVAAEWNGRLTNGRVHGRLNLAQFDFGTIGAKGVVAVRDAGGGAVVVEPSKLTVTTNQKALPEATLVSGRLTADGKGVRAERLLLSGVGGQARVDGGYTFTTRSGEITANWTDLLIPTAGVSEFTGSLTARLTTPFPDRPQVEGRLITKGRAPDGPWDATLLVNGNGRGGWDQMDWTVTAKDLEWRGNYPLSLDGFVARMDTRPSPTGKGGTLIRLIDIDQPEHPAEAFGQYDLGDGSWRAWVNIGSIGVPKSGGAQATLMFGAWGDRQAIRLQEFYVRGAEAELWATGWYVFDKPRPVDLDVYLKHIPRAERTTDKPPIFGFLRGEMHLSGTAAAPRDLDVTGKLLAQDFGIFDRPVGQVVANITGHINNQRAKVQTKRLRLLEGEWDLDAVYTAKTKAVDIGVDVRGMPLKEVGQILKREDFAGRFDGNWKIHVARPNLNDINATGSVTARGVKAGGLDADTLTARMDLKQGQLKIDPIRLRRTVTRQMIAAGAPAPAAGEKPAEPLKDDVTVKGVMDASLRMNLNRPTGLTASLSMASWPLELGTDTWVDVSGGVPELSVDLAAAASPERDQTGEAPQFVPPNVTLNGNVQFNADLTWRNQNVGNATLAMTLLGREADVRRIQLRSMGGNFEGQAMLDADQPLQSTASLSWDSVNAELLGDVVPAARDLAGIFSGSLRVEPAGNPRALEPLVARLAIEPAGGRYRAMDIGPIRLNGYTNLRRYVLNDPSSDASSTIQVAGGVLELWGRFSKHDLRQSHQNVLSTQMTLRFRDLSLDQLVRTGDPESDRTPGLLHGEFSLVGTTTQGRQLLAQDPSQQFIERLSKSVTAQGDVRVTEADLGNIGVFATLYGLMNIGKDLSRPTGHGSVAVRAEGGSIYLSNLRYFNKGTEIRGIFQIDRLWELPASPVNGVAVGTPRPLKDIKLPLLSDFDEILTAILPDLTTVAIGGTIKDYTYRPLAFSEIGGAMRTLIVGDVHRR